jgi:hypothetical protein
MPQYIRRKASWQSSKPYAIALVAAGRPLDGKADTGSPTATSIVRLAQACHVRAALIFSCFHQRYLAKHHYSQLRLGEEVSCAAGSQIDGRPLHVRMTSVRK